MFTEFIAVSTGLNDQAFSLLYVKLINIPLSIHYVGTSTLIPLLLSNSCSVKDYMVLTISRRINQTKTAIIVRSQLFLNMHWMLIYSYLFDCMYKTMKGHKESNRYVFRKWLAVSSMDAEEHFMSQQWRQPHYVEWCNVAIADESDATLTVHNDYLGSGAQEAARRTIHIVATIRVNDCTVHSCWRGAASASACYFTLRVGVDTSDIGHSAPLPSHHLR